ncbi:efflux RND transporter periplasmic adaptor subunit [Methylomicrobium agile]|uniref:efflux RND transporter periplasmic adaptor subunit n=1 Tax=Methylomicrobium agile TaxID=39774 RepID=UPI0004DF42DA|nr:efflux RND transporter periplasmic adaptor subunit [Methylomicrobium agile]
MKNSRTALLALCLALASCTSETETETAESREVIHPMVKDITRSSDYVAEIQSVKYVEVRSKVKGYIDNIHVDEGQAVNKDQLLFTLSALEFEKELQKANAVYKNTLADLKAAKVDLANVKLLAAKNIVSGTELEVAQAKTEALAADVEEAKANSEKAALHIAFTQIRAPFNGTINRIPNKVGSLILEGDMLTSISDNREVFAYFNLSEIDYLNYRTNGEKEISSVGLKLANNASYGYRGKIEAIESEFDRSTGNIAFRARFPNPDGLLKHGANGKVIVDERLNNALLVPQKSTFEIQDKIYLFVVDSEGRLKQRNIVPKMRFEDFYVVESGLSENEWVLFEGAGDEREGKKIRPVPVDPAAVMPTTGKF